MKKANPDTISLLKEYKRDVNLYNEGGLNEYPPMPEHYFSEFCAATLREYRWRSQQAVANGGNPVFPEHLVTPRLHNTWRDTGSGVVGAWIGLIYQLTGLDRHQPFMQGIDPASPLDLD